MTKKEEPEKRKYYAIPLFSGAGGFDIGIRSRRFYDQIADMDHAFHGFESCYGSANIEDNIKSVVSSSAWGRYFDSYTMPTQTLRLLSDSITDEQGVLIDELPFDYIKIEKKRSEPNSQGHSAIIIAAAIFAQGEPQ